MSEITPDSLLIVGPRRGRPSRSGVRSVKRVEFVTTLAEFDALKKVAETQRQPLATVIRDAVNEYVSDYGERRVFRSGPFE